MEKLDDKSSSRPSLYFSKALEGVSQFPLIQALGGRRSRRFCMGAEKERRIITKQSFAKNDLVRMTRETLVNRCTECSIRLLID